MTALTVAPEALAAWCRLWLGSEPASILFEAGNLSAVVGVELADGRAVVVKARPPARRLAGCVFVQRHLSATGYACPRPLVGPKPLDGLAATAEALVAGGEVDAEGADAPARFAAALAALVELAPPASAVPPLAPPPAWLAWRHRERGTWPRPASTQADLNACSGPAWLDAAAGRARRRLLALRDRPVIGHGDFEAQNIRWAGRRLVAVHDWDSVVALPEAAVAGAAAAVYPADGPRGRQATLAETAGFLDRYESCRRRAFTAAEREAAWAAGLWVLAYKSKIETVEGGGPLLEQLAREVDERLERAGV